MTSGDGTTTQADGTLTTAATAPTATVLPSQQGSDTAIWGWTAVAELLAIVLLPGLYVAWVRRQRGAR